MLIFDSATAAELASAADKLDWCESLISILGNNRKLVCKRAASGDPWAGTTFIDCDLQGEMIHGLGEVRNLGATANARIALAADVSTGVSCWRITSSDGTRWVQGSLGAGGDFTVTANPASGDGIAIQPTALLRAPANLPLTGKPAPILAGNVPYTVVIDDWSSGSPVEAGRINFDTRKADLVPEHPMMADAYGEVAVYQSTQSIMHGPFEFGFTLFIAGAHASSVEGELLSQVEGFAKPAASQGWTLYPGGSPFPTPVVGGYDKSVHLTYPPAFKVRYLNQAGVQVGIKQMGDGTPINAPRMQDEFYDPVTNTVAQPLGSGPKWADGTEGVRPHWNCGMALHWESSAPKMNPRLFEVYRGAPTLRPTSGKHHTSVNGNWNLLDTVATGSWVNGVNSFQNIYTMPAWPMPKADMVRPTPIDPYVTDPNSTTSKWWSYATGYMEEPGSVTGRDPTTGPGGPRHMRCLFPTQIAAYVTDPTGARLEGNVPWALINNEYQKAYAGFSIHFCRDVKTGAGIPKAESLAGEWRYNLGAYYGGSYTNPNGAAKTIALYGAGQQAAKWGGTPTDYAAILAAKYDSTGRHPWRWDNHEGDQHGYISPGISAMVNLTPAHFMLDRFAFDSHWMGCLGESAPGSVSEEMYLHRRSSWRMHKSLWTWLCGTRHDLTYTQEQIEARMQVDLEKFYDIVYVPAYVSQVDNYAFKALRNLGCLATLRSDSGKYLLEENNGDLGFYGAGTLIMWKVLGFWSRMWNRSAKCRAVMTDMVRCYDLRSVDWILDANGVKTGELTPNMNGLGYTFTTADIPDSWADWAATQTHQDDIDLIHDSTGSLIRDNNQREGVLMRWQWAEARRWAFPEFPNPRLDAAIAKWRAFDAVIADAVSTTSSAKRDVDWVYARPGTYVMAPPIGYESGALA